MHEQPDAEDTIDELRAMIDYVAASVGKLPGVGLDTILLLYYLRSIRDEVRQIRLRQ